MSHELRNSPGLPSANPASLRTNQSRRMLLISVALAAVGIGLLYLYIQRFEQEATGGQLVQVLTAVAPIQSGMVITDNLLGTREVPVTYLEPRAVKAGELGKVRGLATVVDLDPQDGLLWTDLSISVEKRDLSSLIQPGNRAYTVMADYSSRGSASQGLVKPGDYVDVLATFSERQGDVNAGTSVVLLQRVLVLAVGDETERQAFQGAMEGEKGKARRVKPHSSALTLSVKIEEAQLLSLATERGALSVVMRPERDPAVIDGIPDIDAKDLVNTAVQANRRRAIATSNRPVQITGERSR